MKNKKGNHREKPWNRCDECGRFIPFADFESEEASRSFYLTYEGGEAYDTLCRKCRTNEK